MADARANRDEQQPDRIARRAYQRFEERGREHGHDQEDWFEAEKEVQGRERESERGADNRDRIAGDVDARRLEESARGLGRSSRTDSSER